MLPSKFFRKQSSNTSAYLIWLAQITGRMANRSREIHLDNFRNDDETKIMIASIKTSGLGLDFSVANKCILVDLWWNEPVQDQVSRE